MDRGLEGCWPVGVGIRLEVEASFFLSGKWLWSEPPLHFYFSRWPPFWISQSGRACAYSPFFQLMSANLHVFCIPRSDSALTQCSPSPRILESESHCGRRGWPQISRQWDPGQGSIESKRDKSGQLDYGFGGLAGESVKLLSTSGLCSEFVVGHGCHRH